jgi:cardiolipin synthase
MIEIFDWPSVTGALALLNLAMVAVTMIWILAIKQEPTSALAWCLLVLIIPLGGVLLFFFFGYQNIHRPLNRKKQHAQTFPMSRESGEPSGGYEGLADIGQKLGLGGPHSGNALEIYHEGQSAYDAMLAAIRAAKNHIHMEFFIVRSDQSGREFIEALAERARAGVKVRFLYDAVGSWSLKTKIIDDLTEAGGEVSPFLTLLNPLRRRTAINLRNHRKILIVDGLIGFTGGFNIGDEYLGKNRFFGAWRDTFVRIQGHSVRSLQRIFCEDWDFATDEDLIGDSYFPQIPDQGKVSIQVAWSGPDQDIRIIREVYFAAIMRAKNRVWLATPYFVPDSGLLDALCLAARSGRDVRIVCPFRPDKWIPHLAGRYYWWALMRAGVKIYQYTAGFMHAKLLLIDDEWCSIGSVNFDNRSLYLNFEVTCFIDSKPVAAEIAQAFETDMSHSIRLRPESFTQRPFAAKVAENACRLLSPVL